MHIAIKIIISALVITAVSEIGKRSSSVAAVLASLPLTSFLAMIWLYQETKDLEKITSLSYGIFWAILPSFVFFLSLPLLIKFGFRFWTLLPDVVRLKNSIFSIQH
jgi:uncharacterized membrane protein (GlpM family)